MVEATSSRDRAFYFVMVLALAFVASGIAVIAGLERSHVGESHATFAAHLFTNVAPLTAFALFVAAAVWQRGVAAIHKRLMLLAAIVLTPPAIGRLFGYLDLAQLNLLAYASLAFASAVYDAWARGRPHAVSLLGAAALVAIDVTTTLWLAAVGSWPVKASCGNSRRHPARVVPRATAGSP